jgi:hypothetical protein
MVLRKAWIPAQKRCGKDALWCAYYFEIIDNKTQPDLLKRQKNSPLFFYK